MGNRPYPLTLQSLFARGAVVAPEALVAAAMPDGLVRRRWPEVMAHVERTAGALQAAGVGSEFRVGTLLWNDHVHLELALAAPLAGSALHPANPRLSDADLEWTLREARDRVVVFDAEFEARVRTLANRVPEIERWVRCGDGEFGESWESFLAGATGSLEAPAADENAATAICFTSGTTGHPKQVVYTNRSSSLHTLGLALTDTMNLSGTDTALAVVPIFHAVSWGLPYAAAMLGANLVLPHRRTGPEDLLDLIDAEHVTIAIGVPVVWLGVMHALRREPRRWRLRHLRRIVCGGGAPSLEMIEFFRIASGTEVIHSWGMTEINPVGTMGRHAATIEEARLDPDDAQAIALKAGRPLPFLEVEIVDESGAPLPHDDEAIGSLLVRGPTVKGGFAAEDDESLPGGWMRTGDVASIDDRGRVSIRDREKDLIRSGGEWISSLAMERLIGAMPEVALVAVVAKPDPKWEQRPVAFVELDEGTTLDLETVRSRLANFLPKWQLPDDLVVRELPLTGTGKIDKQALRAMLA